MDKVVAVVYLLLQLSGVVEILAYDVPLLADRPPYPSSTSAGVTCNFSPFNSHHEVVRMQSFYKATELKAAGILPNEPITAIGWKFAAKNYQQNYAAPALNKIQVAYTWIDATSVVLQVWGEKTRTFSYAAGLSVAAKTSISTVLLPDVGQRQFIDLSTPLTWDGVRGLLLEFSMDNSDGTTSILDKNCIAFKFAEASTVPTIFGERARTAYAYIYDDACWHGMGYPWSKLSFSTCSYASQSMSASGFSGVVMDVAFRTAQIATTSTASISSTVSTTPSSTTSASSSSSSSSSLSSSLSSTLSSSSSLSLSSASSSSSGLPSSSSSSSGSSSMDTPTTPLSSSSSSSSSSSHSTPSLSTTVEAQTSAAPPASNHNNATQTTLAIAFAIIFAIIACVLAVIVCVLWRKLQENSRKRDSNSGGGGYGGGGGNSVSLRYDNLVNDDVDVDVDVDGDVDTNTRANTLSLYEESTVTSTHPTTTTINDAYLVVDTDNDNDNDINDDHRMPSSTQSQA